MANPKTYSFIILLLYTLLICTKTKSQNIVLPNQITGLNLWLCGDSVEFDNYPFIKKCIDLSFSNNDATQNNQSLQPFTKPNAINNHNTIQFDGIEDYLSFNTIIDIRTVFWVIKEDSNATSNYRALLATNGGPFVYDFYRDDNHIWAGSNTNNFVLNGLTKLNGDSIDGTLTDMPNKFSIISLTTIGNVSANNFSNDRDGNSGTRVWDGELAELIIYNIPLSNEDVLSVEKYLNDKYAPDINLGLDKTVCDLPITIKAKKDYYTNYLWQDGSSLDSLVINSPGDYVITVTNLFGKISSDTITIIQDTSNYSVDLGVDTTICVGQQLLLNAGSPHLIFNWSNGTNLDTISVDTSGIYSVSVINCLGNPSTDSIIVTVKELPYFYLGNDTLICMDSNPYLLDPELINSYLYSFLWSNSSFDSTIFVNQSNFYALVVTDNFGCKFSDTINILIDNFPSNVSLGNDTAQCSGAFISLINGANETINYLWSTNDTTAQITIDTAGMYWVQVENNNGCVANDTVQIAVNGIAPTVLFNAINACNNSPTLFNSTSFTTDGSNIISSFWTFGTGDTSNLQNPTYNYLATGNYNVTLQIQTDSGCSNSTTQQVQIHKKPTAGFFPTNSLMCSSQNSFFTENSFSTDGIINNWLWDFGTTSISDTSSLQNGSYDYVIAGNYTVQLIVSTEFGCSDTVLNLINVKPSPIANFVFQDSCLTNQTKFTNLSTGTISITNWDFGDANSSALLNPSHVYPNSGSYNVILAIKATNGCWDTLIKPVGIYDNPIANFVTDDYCVLSNNQLFDSSITNAGVLTNWLWDISSLSFQSTNQNPMISFNFGDSGLFQLKLKVTNNYGCIDSITKTIGVYPLPIANFNFSPEIGLPPLQVNFNNQTYGGNSYLWDFNDGNSSIAISPTYTFQDSGIFNVTLFATSLYGCVDSISKTIQIIEPIIDLAVKNIFYEFVPNSNFMKMSVQLANEGRVIIQNMDLILQNSSTGSILETWNGNLAPNLQNIYTFSSMIEMPNGETPSLICVNATNINHGIDADLSNNEFCRALNKFELINLYPNPTSKNLFLEFISPQQSDLEINLFNNVGKLVSNLFKGQSSKGINRLNFLMSIYAQGIYVIEIKNQDEIIRKKFMIN